MNGTGPAEPSLVFIVIYKKEIKLSLYSVSIVSILKFFPITNQEYANFITNIFNYLTVFEQLL